MMGLFDRTVGSLRGKADVSMGTAIMPAGTAAFPNLKYETFVREGYQKNELVYRCVNEWSTDIAEAQIQAIIDGPDGAEPVDDSAAVKLMNNPNPWLSGDDLLSGIEMFKRIAGNSFTLKVRSGANIPRQLWLLRPDRVRIVPSPTKYIDHYEYRVGAQVWEIPPDDIIHDKTQNPYDDWYGMPPLMPASGRTDIDNFLKDMVKGFLQNSGVPAGILQVAGRVSEQEKAMMRARFRGEYGGSNAGNIMIADGGNDAPTYTAMGMPLGARGLVIPELDEMDEARICMVFALPPSLVGSRLSQVHSTLGQGGRQIDLQFFTEQQLVPEWKSIASNWTRQLLLKDFPDEADRLEFDLSSVRSLGENQDALHTRMRSNVTGLVTSIQEARAALGFPADPKPEDIFLVPINVVPTMWKDIIAAPLPMPALPQPVVNTNGHTNEPVTP